MAAPIYNCPFSAGGTQRTCAAVRTANTAGGCPLYNAESEHCSLAENMLHSVRAKGKTTPTG